MDYSVYWKGTAGERVTCIVSGVDFVLGKGAEEKKEFLRLVTEIGKVYALCATSEQAGKINEEISYFKAVKSGMTKRLPKGKTGKTKDRMDYEIGQLVSKSVISEEVVDIFAAARLDKPDLSILSDEFLEEIRNLPQKIWLWNSCAGCWMTGSGILRKRMWFRPKSFQKCWRLP